MSTSSAIMGRLKIHISTRPAMPAPSAHPCVKPLRCLCWTSVKLQFKPPPGETRSPALPQPEIRAPFPYPPLRSADQFVDGAGFPTSLTIGRDVKE